MALNRSLWRTIHSRVVTRMELPLAARLPLAELTDPVFIIGCGRSGTTVFGECLARHPQVTYLHEPREIWTACYSATDIWSRRAAAHHGALALDASDATALASAKLRRIFRYQVVRSRRPVLVEKLPINNFRIPFLVSIFPAAKFIHLSRDGREVAHSIQKRADNRWNGWYGANDYKWKQLCDFARRRSIPDPDQMCRDNYERGLLEWRLSMERFAETRDSIGSGQLLEIEYDDLVEAPLPTLARVVEFIGVSMHERVEAYVHRSLRRRSRKCESLDYSDRELLIMGPLLSSRSTI